MAIGNFEEDVGIDARRCRGDLGNVDSECGIKRDELGDDDKELLIDDDGR